MQQENSATRYQVMIQGQPDEKWFNWIGGSMLNIQHSHGKNTVLTLCVPDQAALRGILNKLWDLNLSLVSVESKEDELEPTNPVS